MGNTPMITPEVYHSLVAFEKLAVKDQMETLQTAHCTLQAPVDSIFIEHKEPDSSPVAYMFSQ